MSRAYAQIFKDIWTDEDFRGLEAGPQRLYLFLLSQENINWAGVLILSPRRWVSRCKNYTVEQLRADLQVLVDRRYVLVDEDEEELLVRTFIRNDGLWRNPKTMKSAHRDALAISSPRLRRAVADELRRLPLDELPERTQPGISADVHDLISRLHDGVATPSATPSLRGSQGVATPSEEGGDPIAAPSGQGVATPSPPPSYGSGAGAGVGAVVQVVEPSLLQTEVPTPPAPPRQKSEDKKQSRPQPPRPDVEQLCARLSEHLASNGYLKRDTQITREWRDEARRLLDRDEVPLDEALRVLDWSQADQFWRQNIRSMPKFRKQYSVLRQRAQESWAGSHAATAASGGWWDN